MTTELCIICVEKLTPSARIKCEYCEFVACKTCCRTYIIQEQFPKCMNSECGREWTREFMMNSLSKTFVNNQWKECREQLLYDRERALLPMTQEIAASRKDIERRETEINELDASIEKLRQRKRLMVRNLNTFRYNLINQHAGPTQETETQKFVKKCPSEECRGYLSSQWKCGTCEIWCCNKCHEIKGITRDADHTCNPGTVATISALATETKNCPNAACGVPIFKIDGCDQMWCTTCHTAFSWRTGRIETNVHNPHYYEYMRNMNNNEIPRNPLDIQCCNGDNQLDHRTFTRIINLIRRYLIRPIEEEKEEWMKKRDEFSLRLERLIQYIIHLRQYVMPRYHVDRVEDNLELRIQYINNVISEQEFKISLQRRAKLNAKKNEYYQVFDMVNTTASSIIMRYEASIREMNRVFNIDQAINDPILEEINPLVLYANECLKKIANTYSSIEKLFSPLLHISL